MPSKEEKTKPIRGRAHLARNIPSSKVEEEIPQAIYYINKITSVFPGRGSCTPALEKAADYIFYVLQQAGLKNLKKDKFPGKTSTYRPYLLVFCAALIGSSLVFLTPSPITLVIGAILFDLALAGFLAQASFSSNWMEWFLPKGLGTNISGCIPAAMETKHTVLLAGHLDAHRTPVFFSSVAWQKAFRWIIQLSIASLIVGFLLFAFAFAYNWQWIRWAAILLSVIYLVVAILCWQADRTPYSPAANDNGSGTAIVIRIAQQLARNPMKYTDVWTLVNDCEETGSDGMLHFLQNHSNELGTDCLIFAPDEVGNSRLQYITSDGLVIQYKSDPRILSIAEKAAQAVDGFSVMPATGIAFTDATAATKRGFAAVSLVSIPEKDEESHWHQLSDLPENIKQVTLEHAELYLLKILEIVDQME